MSMLNVDTYDPWINHLRCIIRQEKRFAKFGDELVKLVEGHGYIISYPEVFKEIYWDKS